MSTTTFMDVVNEVLGCVGEGELTSSTFASATGKQKQAKRIVARAFDDMQNQVPDEHWQRHKEIQLWASKEIGDGDTVGAESIAVSTVTYTGLFDLTNPSLGGTKMLGSTGGTECQDTVVRFTRGVDDTSVYDETQWYRIKEVAATELTLASSHLVALNNASISLSASTMVSTFVRYRVPLPSDFRDVVDVERPFGDGVDIELTDVNGLIRRIHSSKGGDYTAPHPTHYAIGYDTDLADDDVQLGPFLYYWPVPSVHRYYNLWYQRVPQALAWESAAYNDTFDLPEDLMPQLIYAAMARAKLDLAGRADEAQVYKMMEAQKRKDTKERTMTQGGVGQIRPDMSGYRGYYRRGRRGYGIELYVDE